LISRTGGGDIRFPRKPRNMPLYNEKEK